MKDSHNLRQFLILNAKEKYFVVNITGQFTVPIPDVLSTSYLRNFELYSHIVRVFKLYHCVKNAGQKGQFVEKAKQGNEHLGL